MSSRCTAAIEIPARGAMRTINSSVGFVGHSQRIKNTGGIRDLSYEDSDETATLALVSNDTGVSQHEDPW